MRSKKKAGLALTEEDSISNIELEFEAAGRTIEPDKSNIRLTSLEDKLTKKNDWETQLATVNRIVALCKGTKNIKETAKDFRTIVNTYMECAKDARPKLAKGAMLGLASIATSLGRLIDSCADSVITPLLNQTNNGVGTVAESSRCAIIYFCKNVYGKHTNEVLKAGFRSPGETARLAIVQAMIAACDSWPPKYKEGFPELIALATKDKSEKVRETASLFNQDFSALTSAAQTPARQSYIPTKTPAGKTPFKSAKALRDEGITPVKMKALEDQGMTPLKESAPSEIHLDDDDDDEQINTDLNDIIEQDNINTLVEYIETKHPSLFGYMNMVIEVLCTEMQNEMPNLAARLLGLLAKDYENSLYCFINVILEMLPDNDKSGRPIIETLMATYGEGPISSLLYTSQHPYAYYYILSHALKSNDCNEMTNAVYRAIQNDAYEYNHVIIFELFQKIREQDQSKLEYLFMLIPVEMRKSIFTEIESQFPEIVELFKDGKNLALDKLLKKEMRKALAGEDLNIEVIKKGLEANDENSFTAIRVIRECRKFSNDYIPILMVAIETGNDDLAQFSGKVLKHICKEHPETVSKVPECLSTTYYGFRSYIGLIQSAPKEELIKSIESIKDQFIAALEVQDVRNAVLEVVAALVIRYGPDYQTFLGELDKDNQIILNQLIEKRKAKKQTL